MTAGRYERVSLLGEGGAGQVYEAVDRVAGTRVALKTLPDLTPEHALRLKQEFRALRGLHHPNLVRLHQLVVDEQHCFFTMEMVHGEPLIAWCTGRPLGRVVDAFSQLADALHQLHLAGTLHRDLKPSNVLVDGGGTVKVLDFGLSLPVHSRDADAAGTVGWMAPERLWGDVLGPPADWYAFGMMLYEALTGERPLPPGLVPLDPPPPPSSLAERDLPTRLDELAVALLAPEPGRRAGWVEVSKALAMPDLPEHTAPPEVLVGREGALQALGAALDEARDDRPTVRWVTGPSGIGKTHLVHWFLEQQGDDVLVLPGRCHLLESVRYNALDEVVDEISRHLEQHRDLATALPAAELDALITVFPILARVVDPPSTGERSPADTRRLAIRGMGSLLRALGSIRPVVLWIDDAQWADADSRRLLAGLLRDSRPGPLLAVLCWREAEALGPPWGLPDEQILDLAPLSPAESEELVRALGAEVEALAEQIRQAQGHPLFLHELTRRAAGDRPGTLFEALRDRVADQSPADRRLLLHTAAGGPVPVDVLRRALPADPSAIQRLADRHLLRQVSYRHASAAMPYHHVIREAVLDWHDAVELREAHRRLAKAHRDAPHTDPEAVSDHYAAAGMDEQAARYAIPAAQRSVARLAFDRAAELYARALPWAEPERVLACRIGRAESLAWAGRSREAGAAFGAAANEAARRGQIDLAFDLRRRAAEQKLRAGEIEHGTAAIREVLDDAGVPWPATLPGTLFEVLSGMLRMWWRGHDYDLTAESSCDPDLLRRVDACWSAGLGLNMLDLLRSAAFQQRFTRLALDAGEPARLVRALAVDAAYRVNAGGDANRALGARLLREADAIAERCGSYERAFVELNRGVTAYYAGRPTEVGEHLARAQAGFRRQLRGMSWELANCHMYRMWSLALQGDLATLRDLVPSLEREVRERGDRLYLMTLTSGRGCLAWLADDQPEAAMARTREAYAPFADHPEAHTPAYLDLVARTLIHLYRGEPEQAWQALEERWGRLGRAGFLRLQFFGVELRFLRIRAACALAHAGQSRPLARVRRDLRWLERQDLSIAAPLARLSADLMAHARGTVDAASLARHREDLASAGLGLYARMLSTATGADAAWPGVARPRRLARLLGLTLPAEPAPGTGRGAGAGS